MLEGFLVIITGMSYEYGDEDMAIEFCQACAEYLIALEEKLSVQFPYCGFRNLGSQVMSEQIGQIAEKVKPDDSYWWYPFCWTCNEEKKNETATKNASLGTVYSGSSNYGGRTSYSGNYDGDNDDNDDDDEDEEY